MKNVIYSGAFIGLNGGTTTSKLQHSTWEFGQGSILPCKEGQEIDLVVVGIYEDDDITAEIVEWHLADGSILTHQPDSDIPLHITGTIKTAGISPVESGRRAALYPANIRPVRPYKKVATAGYFVRAQEETSCN